MPTTEWTVGLVGRTEDYALRIVRLYGALPKKGAAEVLGRQLLRSGTSVGAHYREAQWAKSDSDFVSKIQGALQELEETGYWLRLIARAGIVGSDRLASLQQETHELIAILGSIVGKVRRRARQ
jgi:four helix bundle protein